MNITNRRIKSLSSVADMVSGVSDQLCPDCRGRSLARSSDHGCYAWRSWGVLAVIAKVSTKWYELTWALGDVSTANGNDCAMYRFERLVLDVTTIDAQECLPGGQCQADLRMWILRHVRLSLHFSTICPTLAHC